MVAIAQQAIPQAASDSALTKETQFFARRGGAMSVARFLKQRAVRIQAAGSYTLGNWYDPQGRPRSFACRTTRVSPFRMLLDAPVVGRIGDRLNSYFRDFGKFDGEISDTIHGGFLLELEMTRARRAKFAEKLVWLEKKQKDPTIRDARKHARFVPNSPHWGVSPGCFRTVLPSGSRNASSTRGSLSGGSSPRRGVRGVRGCTSRTRGRHGVPRSSTRSDGWAGAGEASRARVNAV